MKKESLRILLIEILLFIISCIFIFFIKNNIILYCLCLLCSFLLGFFLLGYDKREVNDKKVISVIVLYSLIYYIFIYILGFIRGFSNNIINYEYFISFIIIILIIELLRNIIVKRCKYNKKIYLILSVFILLFVELVFNFQINSSINIFLLIQLLCKNILLTFIIYNYKFIYGLICRFLMDIPLIIIPLVPNIGNLNIVVNVVFILFILFAIDDQLLYNSSKIHTIKFSIKDRIGKYINIALVIVLICSLYLVTGIGRFYALTIATGSMSNTINIGDIVIIDKKKSSYKLNDIIAFKHEGKIIVHRIVKKIGDNSYKTKGDFNNNIDNWDVDESIIVGEVVFKIKYLGIPAILINNWFIGGE